MFEPQRKFRILLVLLWTLLLASTSVTSAPEDKLIFMFDNQFVALVPQDIEDAIPNDQPVIVSVYTLSKILESVLVKTRKNSKSDNRLFGENEIYILSQTLSSALAKASPDQDILFKTQSGQGSAANLAVKKGRAFWRDSRLHLLFAEIQDAKKSDAATDRQQVNNENTQFGSRVTQSRKVDFAIMTTQAVMKEKSVGGVTRSDWISIDTNQLLGYTIAPNSAITNNTGEEAISTDRLGSTKEKLAKLKFMRDNGMLSEEDYENKVRELLDEAY